MLRHSAKLTVFIVGALVAARVLGAPEAGAALPSLRASDVTGASHRLKDLIDGPTLLVAITDRDGGNAMRAWFGAADTRAPRVHRVAIISIGKPFFVSDAYARSKARQEVPRRAWHTSLMDTDHGLARTLGLDGGATPYAFAIDGEGRVLAVVHGSVDDPRADQVWTALEKRSHGAPPPSWGPGSTR